MMIATLTGNLTALVSIVGLAAVLGGVYATWRGNAGAALHVLRDANEILTGRVRELETKVKQQDEIIGLLKAKTDLTIALAPLADRLEHHEQQAAERNVATLKVLNMIADRLTLDGAVTR